MYYVYIKFQDELATAKILSKNVEFCFSQNIYPQTGGLRLRRIA